MKTNLLKKSFIMFSALAFSSLVTMSGAVHASNNSDHLLLARNATSRLDAPKPHPQGNALTQDLSEEMILAKVPAGTPKGKQHGIPRTVAKPPKAADNSAFAEMMFAKNKAPGKLPRGAPVDAPIKNAPHPPGAIHG